MLTKSPKSLSSLKFPAFLLLVIAISSEVAEAINVVHLPDEQMISAGKLDSVGMLVIPALHEVSGIALSRKDATRVWVHNDSGGAPRLFGFKIPPQSHFSWGSEVEQLFLEGRLNNDWEDMFSGSDGDIYIADTGNNLKKRKLLNIFRIREPEQKCFAQSVQSETIAFRYAKPGNPNEIAVRDCEAICEFENGILLFSKRLLNSRCDVFYLPNVISAPVSGDPMVADFLFRIDNLRGVTAADSWIDPKSGKISRIAILSYGLIWVWDMENGAKIDDLKVKILGGKGLKIHAGLCEALTFENRDSLLICNEQRDVFRVSVEKSLMLY